MVRTRRLARALPVTVVLLSAGCDVAPPAVAHAEPPLARWWTAFGDPVLDDLVARAWNGNHGLAAAALRLQAARELQGAAGAAFAPTLGIAAGPIASVERRNGYYQVGFDARWELPWFGRGAATEALAAADVGAAEAAVTGLRVSLAAEVARTYFEVRHAEALDATLNELVITARERVRLAEALVATRQAAADTLPRVRATLADAEAALVEPALALAASRHRLRVLLGDLETEVPPAKVRPTAPPLADLAALPTDVVRSRPDVRAAEQQVLRAAANADLARAELMPHLGLGAALGWLFPITGPAAGSLGHASLALGPTLELPIFDWGRRKATTRAREAEFEAAWNEYREQVLTAFSEVRTAVARLELERRRGAALARSEEATSRDLEGATTRARLRLGDELELAAARDLHTKARIERSRAELAEYLAWVALFKALGGGVAP